MIEKFLARFRKKKIEEPAIKVTPYDVAHGLYLQMISETSYSFRDRTVTDREYGYGSSCCGAEVINEEEEIYE